MNLAQPHPKLSETTRWGIGIIIMLLMQTFGIGWYLAALDAQVQQNSSEIGTLKSGAAVYLTRQQLEDILGGRDAETRALKDAVLRMESKIDRYFQ